MTAKNPGSRRGWEVNQIKLLQTIKGLLQNLPVFQTFEFFLRAFVDAGFLDVLRRLGGFVENAEVAGEGFAREFVRGGFVGDVVRGGDEIERTALARVRSVE